MSDLVEFLRARLDADAAYLRDGTCNCWQPTTDGKCENLPDCPARILREIDAKRRMLDRYADLQRLHADPQDVERRGERNRATREGYLHALEIVFRDLASVHADHPDYRKEWRP